MIATKFTPPPLSSVEVQPCCMGVDNRELRTLDLHARGCFNNQIKHG